MGRADRDLDVADVTNDGIADVVFGGTDPGTIAVFAGPIVSLDPAATVPDAWWVNGATREGTSVVVGDLDGDGAQDLVQLVRDADWGDAWDDNPGELTVILGPMIGAVDPAQTVTLSGPTLGHPLGSVAGVGDPDGDGDGDFALALDRYSPLYLVDLGAAGPTPYDFEPWLEAPTDDWSVSALRNVGDLDGDGLEELAAHDRTAERVHLISIDALATGHPAFAPVTLLTSGAFEMILVGGGDGDGDGVGDLLIGPRNIGREPCVLTEVPPPGEHEYAAVGSCWRVDPEAVVWDLAWMSDLDGDGLDEVAAAYRSSDGAEQILVLPALGGGNLDDAPIRLPFPDLVGGYLAVGDVSDGGLDDIVFGGGVILGEDLAW